MNILLLGEASGTRRILNKILEKSRHQLIQQAWEDMPELDLEQYDMVLIDGNVCDCSEQMRLLEWVREARRLFPDLPVAALNYVGTSVAAENAQFNMADHSCGVSESGDGIWRMRCRLKELALSETAALLRDACERQPLEPVVFEYSGQG
ncbi:conserved hypothetical protein [Candidatus Nitrotoga sp. HW29]|uniref:hypothetical protein n=1 Tax=Candidatus Nitrotoga sp. HW29 TaxID=2886963 RepID=UPI001EF2E1B8|nr:hypothetical protein [Candidatus Nitrotoga sp. HW29]CAH1904538.1 conserved hypothetical protein [Candidatus Nitrotoga sp. HW29]